MSMSFRPEHYFSVAFLVITFLNISGAALLVASKGYRQTRKSRSERRIAETITLLKTWDPKTLPYPLALERLVSGLRTFEFRSLFELLAREQLEKPRTALSRFMLESQHLDRVRSEAERGGKWPRIDALIVLGHIRHLPSLPLLTAALHESDTDTIFGAVQALAIWDSPDAVEILCGLLHRDCAINPSRVATAIEATTADICDTLCRKSRSADPVTTYWAAKLLGRYPRPESQTALRHLAQHSRTDVRMAAFSSLALVGDGVEEETLITGLADPEWAVRAQAARACGERRVTKAIPRLVELFRDREWWVRSDAREAIERIGSPTVETLVRALSDSDRFARNTAAEALEKMGFVDAAVWELTKGGEAQREAIEILSAIRQAEGAPALQDRIVRVNPALLERVRGPLGLGDGTA